MFVLKSLGRLILGNASQTDLLTIPGGRLLVIGAEKEEEYLGQASLTLKRADAPHSFRLEVEDETGQEPEESFEVSLEMKFQKSLTLTTNYTCFEWSSGELLFMFELSPSTLATTIEMFHMMMAQCLYETVNNKSHTTATDSELQSMMVTSAKAASNSTKKDDDSNHEKRNDERVFESEALAGWYVFDPNTGLFAEKAEQCRPIITRDATHKFKYYLVVMDSKEDAELHRQLIDPDATHHTDRVSFSFVWCFLSENGYIWTFSLRFPSAASVMALSNAIGQAMYEVLNEEKIDADDAKYLLNPFGNDVEMKKAPPLEIESENDSGSDNDGADDDDGMEKHAMDKSDERISNLAVGYKYDRSFVSKGSSLGVFKHTEDDRLEPYTVIESGFKTLTDKTAFNPSRMMLHQEDSALLLMNPDEQQKIYKMDLEVGKVVEEWSVKDDAKVTSILPSSKYAQMTLDPTLIGLNDSSLFRIDPRISGPNKRVDAETKSYVVKNKFSCGATTGKGELAVASAKGDIRLFNKLDKRAKTLLPGFGDPILGIDVTESGKWIIATCKTYLLLVNTEIDGTDSLGFAKSMPDKPKPVRLQLKPEHVAYMSIPVSFTPARFSTGESEEKSIITSTGPYVVSWNFRRVKQGKLWDYQLKRYAETIVADNFRFGQDRAMIVAMPHHVTMMTKKSLSTPSPQVFRKQRAVDVVEKAPF